MRRILTLSFVTLVLFLGGAPGYSQDCIFKTKEDDSLRQALKDFHDLLSSLVHGPAEKGDFAPVRAQAGEFSRLRGGIMASTLPARLGKRCPEISAKAQELSKAVDSLATRAKENAPDAAVKAAFDSVHVAYRNLSGAMTSLDDLLQAFHDVLRPLWHDAYPNKDAAAIKAETPKLKVRAKLILSTAEGSDKPKAPGARKLLDAVATLDEAVAAKDDASVLEALRIVHDAYENLAGGHQ